MSKKYRSAVIDFFRNQILHLPRTPAPKLYQFEADVQTGFDYEYTARVPQPSPLMDEADARAAAQQFFATQNKTWHDYFAQNSKKETSLDLFPPYLEFEDCYPMYSPEATDWVRYWQVNFRVMLPTVRIGRVQHKAAVQGEYIRLGIYDADRVVTLHYHHFAVEPLNSERYFFAPADESKKPTDPIADGTDVAGTGVASNLSTNARTPADGTEAPDSAAKTAFLASAARAAKTDTNVRNLLWRRIDDAYAAYLVCPEGYLPASVSAVKGATGGEKEEDKAAPPERYGSFIGEANGIEMFKNLELYLPILKENMQDNIVAAVPPDPNLNALLKEIEDCQIEIDILKNNKGFDIEIELVIREIKVAGNVINAGGVTYLYFKGVKPIILIKIKPRAGIRNQVAALAHELKHVMQFYEGQLDFTDKFTSGMLNSVQDELSAYRRQLAIGADSIGILSNDLNIITLEFITLLDPTYGTLPNTVLTINDTINHIEQAHIASGSIFTPQFQIFRNNGIDFAKKYCEVLEFIREVYFFDKLNQKVKNR